VDDTQLYVALLPANYSQDISALESYLNCLRIWFCENGMALNPTKSAAILFGTPKRLKSFSGVKRCNVAGTDIQLSKFKILGAMLDSNLTREPHTKALSSSCFYHIRSFKQIRSSLDDGMAVSVASALVSSRLDQVNFIVYGCSFKAYKSPSACPECAGKSRYLSASIHLSTLIHCITPKPPLATHWMASTFQTGHLGV